MAYYFPSSPDCPPLALIFQSNTYFPLWPVIYPFPPVFASTTKSLTPLALISSCPKSSTPSGLICPYPYHMGLYFSTPYGYTILGHSLHCPNALEHSVPCVHHLCCASLAWPYRAQKRKYTTCTSTLYYAFNCLYLSIFHRK